MSSAPEDDPGGGDPVLLLASKPNRRIGPAWSLATDVHESIMVYHQRATFRSP
jgi:hypothetical protein